MRRLYSDRDIRSQNRVDITYGRLGFFNLHAASIHEYIFIVEECASDNWDAAKLMEHLIMPSNPKCDAKIPMNG